MRSSEDAETARIHPSILHRRHLASCPNPHEGTCQSEDSVRAQNFAELVLSEPRAFCKQPCIGPSRSANQRPRQANSGSAIIDALCPNPLVVCLLSSYPTIGRQFLCPRKLCLEVTNAKATCWTTILGHTSDSDEPCRTCRSIALGYW